MENCKSSCTQRRQKKSMHFNGNVFLFFNILFAMSTKPKNFGKSKMLNGKHSENISKTFGRILTIFTVSQMTRCLNATCTLLTISHKSVCDGDDIHLFLLTSSVMCAFFSVRVTPFSSLSFPHRLNTRWGMSTWWLAKYKKELFQFFTFHRHVHKTDAKGSG